MSEITYPILFLVPARGGSKGIPRKNLSRLAGRPLLAHVILAAREASRTLGVPDSRLIVSTEDAEIAETAREWGAEVPFLRPADLARDSSPTIDCVLHVLGILDNQDYRPRVVVLMQVTSPLTAPEDVCGAVHLHLQTLKPVVSVTENEHPLDWSFYLQNGELRPITSGPSPTQRQDVRTTYRTNGAVYVATPEQLRTNRTFLTADAQGYVMPQERSIDIDTPFDLELTRSLLAIRANASPGIAVDIAGRGIAIGQPCFIIAEAGVNHNGDISEAKRLIDVAADCKADAVKFQTFRTERLVGARAPKAKYQLDSTDPKESQFDMLRRLELTAAAHAELAAHCREREILFLSTPFDYESADLLHDLGVPAFKISSGEVTNWPFLEHIARKGRPVLLSTGMALLKEVQDAVEVIRNAGCQRIALLHCVSNYPAAVSDCNLRAMDEMRAAFHVPVGYSDHTTGIEVALAAVARGANIVEKHFTLDREMPGPDHHASLLPDELKAMVAGIRRVESALGHGRKEPAASEADTALVARRSLVAACDIPAGTKLTRTMIDVKRPATGIPPQMVASLIGRTARVCIPADSPFSLDMLQ